MKNIKTSFTNKLGFTLVELLLVVGVISILSTGAYVVYKKWQINNRAQTAADKTRLVFAQMAQLREAGFYRRAITDNADPQYKAARNLVNAKLIPASLISPLSTVQVPVFQNEFGTFTVQGDEGSTTILYDSIPRELCAAYIVKVYDSTDAFMIPSKTGSIGSYTADTYVKPGRADIINSCTDFEGVPWPGIWSQVGLTQVHKKGQSILASNP